MARTYRTIGRTGNQPVTISKKKVLGWIERVTEVVKVVKDFVTMPGPSRRLL
jgi:hypothetical protein